MATASRPSLDLTVAITDGVGGPTYLWGPGARFAGDVPRGLSFKTRQGDGFADASVTLSRRIDRDYVDLGLLREVTIVGTDGSIAYEGRVQGMPRSLQSAHEVSVNMAGWMSHAKDRKMTAIYVDRDLTRWQTASVQRRINLAAASFGATDPQLVQDTFTGSPSLRLTTAPKWTATTLPACEALYDANGIAIGSLYYAWKRSANLGSGGTSWSWQPFLAVEDTLVTTDATGDLEAAGPGSGTLTATTTNRVFAAVSLSYGAGPSGADNTDYSLYWTCLAVYGTHGLTKRGTASFTDPQGFTSSDVIRHLVATYCPKLSTAGVQDTSYVQTQVVFRERTYPYDAFLSVNRPHRWLLSCYDNKTIYYRPTDLTDYDWEVRLSDFGTAIQLQGDDTENLANGIAVNYTDVNTGMGKTLTPDNDSSLADVSPTNPANVAGYKVWTELDISTPITKDMALQMGRAALADFNAPKAPGTITVKSFIRDRAGHWQPVWKVRADDRIAITDHPNDRPRQIVETDYDHDSRTITIGVDATIPRVDAVLDRINGALGAAGLQ